MINQEPLRTAPRASALAMALVAATLVAGAAHGAPITSTNRDVLLPNTGAFPTTGVSLNGTAFINRGLQGVGRVSASSVDSATGETLGSISDMQITGWQRNSDGSYSGQLNTAPDRGFNSGTLFSNYAARINTFDFKFTPHTSNATTTAQNQIAMTFNGSTRFTYDHDNDPSTAAVYSTGLLASGQTSAFGLTMPAAAGATTQSDGTVTNRLTLDTEALVLDTRTGRSGSGWIGDEYGANIYHFDANKQIDGVLKLPDALVPHAASGAIDFLSDPAANGRRVNQGMEGVAVHGDKLFALLQSATLQDSASGNVGRSNTRLVVYDIAGSDAPSDPIAQYVIQLPRVDDNGGTAAVNRTAAQSSIIALNDHQLLILSRDGNGRGASGSPVFKSILLADLSAATNIDGSFDSAGAAVAPGGTLNAAVTPIEWTEALNLLGKLDLGITELEQFGLNLLAGPGDINSVSEKWEGLALVSALDPLRPNDYFLFVGNDNDFLTQNVHMFDAAGDLQTYTDPTRPENDSLVLAFRVSTFVPSPGAWALLAVGLPLLIARRRARATRLVV